MDKPTCKTCPYIENVDGGEIGKWSSIVCHRRAPIGRPFADQVRIEEGGADSTSGDTQAGDTIWPWTRWDDWCGEHPDFPAWLQQQRGKEVEPRDPHNVPYWKYEGALDTVQRACTERNQAITRFEAAEAERDRLAASRDEANKRWEKAEAERDNLREDLRLDHERIKALEEDRRELAREINGLAASWKEVTADRDRLHEALGHIGSVLLRAQHCAAVAMAIRWANAARDGGIIDGE